MGLKQQEIILKWPNAHQGLEKVSPLPGLRCVPACKESAGEETEKGASRQCCELAGASWDIMAPFALCFTPVYTGFQFASSYYEVNFSPSLLAPDSLA